MPEPSRHDESGTVETRAEIFARLADVPLDEVDKVIGRTEDAYADLNGVRGHDYWGDLVLRQGAAVRALREAREALAALQAEAVGARNAELGVLVATGVLDGQRRYAHDDTSKAELVDWLLSAEGGRASVLHVWDRPHVDDESAGPYLQIRAVVDAETRCGALVFTEEGDDGELTSWHTHAPLPLPSSPELRFDAGSALIFPGNAVVSWEAVRSGLAEFARTGACPESVSWQAARWSQP
ncbi:hypothetical protein GIY23_09710 [Allosaccharopolyspora coralli]|uniref:Uncharacterized protein n=1 Tax=Allosaccharopolyspora coralli TaxID=2665642 RepID=A0A5Q3Q580_9PSEU|nr:Imm1 family immunity protein [Allosaccharopolyspora coralli]QGK69758.1 hypothetical protein GIY23_09710 [Allosaccharopolyspora coralli]